MTRRGSSKNRRQPGERSNYDVGYGRPPVKSRFKPGKSGNPRGRPKGSKNVATIVREILNHRVQIQLPSGSRKGTIREAIIWKQVELATRGDGRAARTVFDLDELYRGDTGPDEQSRLTDEDDALLQAMIDRNRKRPSTPK